MKATVTIGILGLLLSGGYGPSFAATYEVTASEYVLIQNEQGEFRALVDFALPEGFQNFDIEMAKLAVYFGPITEVVEMWLFPVTTAWTSQSAGWNSPWSLPGGDYDDAHALGMYVVNGDAPIASFTVTEALQILQHVGIYRGFIIMPPAYERVGFEENLMQGFPQLNGIKLVISTR